jgi:anti-sigma factor RsiW
MATTINDKNLMKRFLLRELPGDELLRLEERLLNDTAFFEEMLLAEDELIETYIRGLLTPKEKQQFEQNFIKAPEQREKVILARAMKDYFERLPETPEIRESFLTRLQEWFSISYLPQLAAASLILVIMGSIFLLIRREERAPQVAENRPAVAPPAAPQVEPTVEAPQALPPAAPVESPLKSADTGQPGTRKPQALKPAPEPEAVETFVLTGGVLMSSGTSIDLKRDTKKVAFELYLGEDGSANYSAEVMADEEKIYSKANIKPSRNGRTVRIVLPVSLLKHENYKIVLKSPSPQGEQVAGIYSFQIKQD